MPPVEKHESVPLKIAIIHYWLVNWRGGERVLEALLELYPEADVFTHVVDPRILAEHLGELNVSTTFIDRMPFSRKLYKMYLPLMPVALEQLDLRKYDLVISSESGPAKGVIVPPRTCHVCYCHTPSRYVWDMYHDYMASASWLVRCAMRPLMHYIRLWDILAAQRVDYFIANSNFVAKRIAKFYRRDSTVIYPPVAVEEFQPGGAVEDYYLTLGQLVPYKKVDIAVKAFNSLGKRLVVIGEGEQMAWLKKIAGSNVELLGRQPLDSIKKYYGRCRALIFPGIEDFGIVPLEAMASGRPVIAYRAGGALETVVDGITGRFFSEQTPECLARAVVEFEAEAKRYDPSVIRTHALKFGKDVFKKRMSEFMSGVMRQEAGGYK